MSVGDNQALGPQRHHQSHDPSDDRPPKQEVHPEDRPVRDVADCGDRLRKHVAGAQDCDDDRHDLGGGPRTVSWFDSHIAHMNKVTDQPIMIERIACVCAAVEPQQEPTMSTPMDFKVPASSAMPSGVPL